MYKKKKKNQFIITETVNLLVIQIRTLQNEETTRKSTHGSIYIFY